MGFHKLYADLIQPHMSANRNVALLGDQEIVDDAGNWLPFSSYFGRIDGLIIDVFEHPRYTAFKNNGRHINLDLATVSPERLLSYDLVVDGGTLEHVSNFVQPFAAFWTSLNVGGYFVFSYPVNNLVDHGYWLPQPRFFRDFFCINGGRFKHLEIFQHPVSKFTAAELVRTPYVSQPPETMAQPSYIKTDMTAGIFAIVEKIQSGGVLSLPLEEMIA